jgi:transcriptional regulator with XRE-family HTH domain
VRRSTVARIEKAIHEPKVSTLVAISTALEVPLASPMSGLPDPLPPGAPLTAAKCRIDQ